jgi:hypothetical protein
MEYEAESNTLSEEDKLRLVKFLDALIEMDFEDGRISKRSDEKNNENN